MNKSFKLVTENNDPLPSQTIPKKVRGKKVETTFNVLDELDIDPDKEEEVFTVTADLYDYGSMGFKSINALVAYTAQKGFPCYINRNGKPWGYWSPDEGITKF
jgi:hypothetical protein